MFVFVCVFQPKIVVLYNTIANKERYETLLYGDLFVLLKLLK